MTNTIKSPDTAETNSNYINLMDEIVEEENQYSSQPLMKQNNFDSLFNQQLKEEKYTEQLQEEKEYFESRCNKLEQQILSLKKKNNELEDEASKYQSALGIATNFNLSEDDENHNVKLNKDILSLHDTLEIYVTNLKSKVDLNINEAKKLLLKYGCQTKISDKEPNKPLIKAVLQRHVLEEILKQANFYFTSFAHSNKVHHLESHIVSQTTVLIDLMENFYNNRLGDDEITRLSPVRLRQQVFTALGTRGFNDIKKFDSKSSKHDFICVISKRINKIISSYRTIKDIEKREYVNALAEDLVRDVVRIFYFRLLIQEPIAQYHWFKNGEKINKSYMKGSLDEDDVEDMVVEICSFPLILKPSHPDGFKVCTPAKVFPRYYVKPSITKKVMNIGLSVGRKLKNIYSRSNSSNDETQYTDEYYEYYINSGEHLPEIIEENEENEENNYKN